MTTNDTKEEKSDETEDQLALVPTSFFRRKAGHQSLGCARWSRLSRFTRTR